MDDNIYGVSEEGGNVRKLVDVPEGCGGATNTFAISPDEESIAFEKDGSADQLAECTALWISNMRGGSLRRIATGNLKPLTPFWFDNDTVLFSGEKNNKPVGIYKVSLNTGKVTPLLYGPYATPFVCNSEKVIYFSWKPKLRKEKLVNQKGLTVNNLQGFHIWKMPLAEVLEGER